MSEVKKAVVYARYSSHNQRDESIEDQVAACRKFALENDYRIIQVYADYAKSGRSDNRDEFQRMLRDSKKGEFEYVLMWKLDRFGRNVEETIINKLKLKKNNVKIVSVTEEISDTPEGALMETVIVGLNEYYSRNLSRNVKRGLYSNAKKCYANSRAPLGYKIVDHVYVIDEDTAPIIEYIYDSYLAGYTITQIIKNLTDRGITSKSGKRFTGTYIVKLLKNRKYMGEYSYGEIVVEDGMPAIIDKKKFFQVQEKLKHKKHYTKHPDLDEYILAGKIYCGECGEAYTTDTGTGYKGKIYQYYKCKTKKYKHGDFRCPSKPIPKDIIEEAVLKTTLETFFDDETIEAVSKSVSTSLSTTSLVTEMEHELKKKESKLDNLMDSLEKGITSERVIDRINTLQKEIDDLYEKISVEKITHPPISQEEVQDYMRKLKDGLEAEKGDLSALLDIFLEKVVVESNGRCTLHYRTNLTPNSEDSSSIEYQKVNLKSKKLNQIWVNSYGKVIIVTSYKA